MLVHKCWCFAAVELEVLKRSGSSREKKYAAAIAPLINNAHFLLVGGMVLITAAANVR
jgi:hypothetical protein